MSSSSTPATWTDDPRSRFGAADEIEISTRRDNGSLRAFVPVLIVAAADALYVRSYRGLGGAWRRHAIQNPAGVIRAVGQHAEVTFTRPARGSGTSTGPSTMPAGKYGRYRDTYLQPMLAEQAVAATLRITPQP